MYLISFFFLQADSIKKSLKGGSGSGGCSLDSKMQQVKELEDEVRIIDWKMAAFLFSYISLDGQRGQRIGCARRRKRRKVKKAQL